MIIVWILSFQYIFQAFDIKLLNCRCHTFTPEGPGKPGFPCGPGGPWKQRCTWLRNTQSKGDHWGHWTGLHFNSEVGVGYYFMLGTCRCIHTLFPFHCLFVLWDRSAVPRGPCLCIRTLWDVLCLLPVCLPVQVTTYGCDFPHPYTFPLVSGVPQREGHSATCAKSFLKMDPLQQVSLYRKMYRSREWWDKMGFFLVEATKYSSGLQRGTVWKK